MKLLVFLATTSLCSAQLTWEATSVQKTPPLSEGSGKYVFKAKNTGNEPVKITAVTSTCACLEAKANKENIAPGEEVTLLATMDYSQLQGEHHKQIIITTKSPTEQRVTLEAVAKLEAIFEIDAVVAKFVQQAQNGPHKATIKILGKEPIPLKLGAPSSKAATATMEEKVPGREYVVTITPSDLSKRGFGSVTLTSESPYPRAKQVSLFYTVVAPR
jgi:hypothetical protein